MFERFKKKNTTINLNIADRRIITSNNNISGLDSVLFFTTHKCASTFIPKLFRVVCENSSYELYDYANSIRKNTNLGKIHLGNDTADYLSDFLSSSYDQLFFKINEIYAPLRYPVQFPGSNNFKHIFFLRDPRDVAVSAFHSFSRTHVLSNNSKVKEFQLKKRAELQEMGIDQFALRYSKELTERLNKYKELKDASSSSIYLTYDQFKDNTLNFVNTILDYLNISVAESELTALLEEFNPKQTQLDQNSHRRSGKSKQFNESLKPETVLEINEILAPVLNYWGFIKQRT